MTLKESELLVFKIQQEELNEAQHKVKLEKVIIHMLTNKEIVN